MRLRSETYDILQRKCNAAKREETAPANFHTIRSAFFRRSTSSLPQVCLKFACHSAKAVLSATEVLRHGFGGQHTLCHPLESQRMQLKHRVFTRCYADVLHRSNPHAFRVRAYATLHGQYVWSTVPVHFLVHFTLPPDSIYRDVVTIALFNVVRPFLSSSEPCRYP